MPDLDPILIQDFTYELPDDRIALHPLPKRDDSKLLVYEKGVITHAHFRDVTGFVPENSILFFNNTKVIPARLHFQKDTGATIEIFLLEPVWPSPLLSLAMYAEEKTRWRCAIGNSKRWRENTPLTIKNSAIHVTATLLSKERGLVEFEWSPSSHSFSSIIQSLGNIPLPPYIKRKAGFEDRERYQTVYSKHDGAVAAPTAGLHFTEEVMNRLTQKGSALDYLTLHVSAGTFLPIAVENANAHLMHSEQVIVTKSNVLNLIDNKKIVAVGTTSLRTLESLYWYGVKLLDDEHAPFHILQNDCRSLRPKEKQIALGAILKKMEGEKVDHIAGDTSIYIVPGYQFRIVDALITNFHRPGSTLILLVAAFVGNDWKKIYRDALTKDYRFLSYGDSSLLFCNED